METDQSETETTELQVETPIQVIHNLEGKPSPTATHTHFKHSNSPDLTQS